VTSARQLVWDDLLSAIVDQGEVVAGEEVSDFCSLLMLADQVFVAGDAEHPAPARVLALCLAELGFAARIADCDNLADVTPDDVLVVVDVTGSDALATQLKPALQSRPIFLAITAGALLSPLAAQADAAVILRISRSHSSPDQPKYLTGLQLMCFLAVDAIRSNLVQRIEGDQRLIQR
jgi:DNA-binding MurR/RpiR family transcriptional regulator